MKQKTFFNRRSVPGSAVLLLTLWISAGCGDNSLKLTTDESKAFASAPAETKQQWEKALAADKASDYATAQTLLDGLTQAQLSDEQQKALAKERALFGERLWAAAEKNDPAAIKAVQDAHKSRNRSNTLPAR